MLIKKSLISNNILYVSALEGLNLCSKPGINAPKISALNQNAKLTVLKRTLAKETINGITDYWYEVKTKDKVGWVFGGYTSNNPIINISGIYYFNSINIKKNEYTYTGDFFDRTDELICEIECLKDENYLLKFCDPTSILYYGNISQKFKFPPENTDTWFPDFIDRYKGSPLYYTEKKDGGGVYMYFYFNENKIILDYQQISNMNDYLEEGEPPLPLEWLEFTIVFKKRDS